MPGTAHDEDKPGLGRLIRATDAEYGNADGRGLVAELQEALLPTALPVLPRARIAARYLLARRLLSVSRGGTVPLVADLTGVTQLASAGVRVLYEVSEQLTVHGQELTLVTVRGSPAHLVLDLVRLDHVTVEASA